MPGVYKLHLQCTAMEEYTTEARVFDERSERGVVWWYSPLCAIRNTWILNRASRTRFWVPKVDPNIIICINYDLFLVIINLVSSITFSFWFYRLDGFSTVCASLIFYVKWQSWIEKCHIHERQFKNMLHKISKNLPGIEFWKSARGGSELYRNFMYP